MTYSNMGHTSRDALRVIEETGYDATLCSCALPPNLCIFRVLTRLCLPLTDHLSGTATDPTPIFLPLKNHGIDPAR